MVLLFNLSDLVVSILGDLIHRLTIVVDHRVNVLSQVSDLLLLLRKRILVILFFLVQLLSVLFVHVFLGFTEATCLLLLMLLQSLILSCIFEHPLRVLISSVLNHLMVLVILLLQSFLELINKLSLTGLELLNLALDHHLLTL